MINFPEKKGSKWLHFGQLNCSYLPNHELGFDGVGRPSHHIASKKAWWILIIHL